MPRCVLLYHICPPHYVRPTHWDLMLESGDTLRTWALGQLPRGWHAAHSATQRIDTRCPALAGANAVVAEQLADHRREYLEFEGDLNGKRGRVARIAAGEYLLERDLATTCRVLIAGDLIQGRVELARTTTHEVRWTLHCEPPK